MRNNSWGERLGSARSSHVLGWIEAEEKARQVSTCNFVAVVPSHSDGARGGSDILDCAFPVEVPPPDQNTIPASEIARGQSAVDIPIGWLLPNASRFTIHHSNII